jgi:hypothetical protein
MVSIKNNVVQGGSSNFNHTGAVKLSVQGNVWPPGSSPIINDSSSITGNI